MRARLASVESHLQQRERRLGAFLAALDPLPGSLTSAAERLTAALMGLHTIMAGVQVRGGVLPRVMIFPTPPTIHASTTDTCKARHKAGPGPAPHTAHVL